MARRDQNANRGLVKDLRPIGAGIEPLLLRVAGDGIGAGTDVAAAVLFVPNRRREFQNVDGVAHQHVFEDRPVVDDLVRHDFRLSQERLTIGVAQLPFRQMVGEAERHVAPRSGEHVHQQTKARRTAVDVLEHDARPVLGAQNRLSSEPDILLPVGAAHHTHFAEPLGFREPFAQIVIGDARRVVQTHGCSTPV
jgi:hypothetical protein